MRIHLENGKYTYEHDEHSQRVLRYGEPWRDLCGDKFVGAMADEITRLQDELAAMTEERDRLLVTPPEKREDLWCVISDLCDQLAATANKWDEAQSQCRSYNLYEVQLKQQLREALAACEVKDAALLRGARRAEELKKPCGMDPESKQAIRNGEYMNVSYFLREALAIQPDATALHAWFKEQLGEPVMEFVQSPNGNYIEMKWQSVYEAKLGDKLYSPKGVEDL